MKKNLVSSSPGEVERLLREYRQNQELVRKIGGVSYQIIYPVQMRHHEKMGISTREIGGSKVRYSLGRRNVKNSNNPTTVCHQFHLLTPILTTQKKYFIIHHFHRLFQFFIISNFSVFSFAFYFMCTPNFARSFCVLTRDPRDLEKPFQLLNILAYSRRTYLKIRNLFFSFSF